MAFPPDAYRFIGGRNLAGKPAIEISLQPACPKVIENQGKVPFPCAFAFLHFLFQPGAISTIRC
jgi:hypothetical protein